MKQEDRIHVIDFEMHIRRWMYEVARRDDHIRGNQGSHKEKF